MKLATPIDDLLDDLIQMRNEHLRFQCLMARATEFQFAGPNGRYVVRNMEPKSDLAKVWDVHKYDGDAGGIPQYVLVEKLLTVENACRIAADKAGLTEGIMSPWYIG